MNNKENKFFFKESESAYHKVRVQEEDVKKLEVLLKDNHITFERVSYFDDFSFYKTKDLGLDVFKSLLSLKIIQFEPLHYVTHFGDNAPEGIDHEIQDAKAHPHKIVLGLLDSGVQTQRAYESFIYQELSSDLENKKLNFSHGTFIAGQWLYQKEPFLYQGADVLSIPIVSVDKETEDIVIKRIIAAISSHPTVKVWNLAVSVMAPIEETCFSDMALVLDRLQDEYNCIICKTVANNFEFLSDDFKMHQGADSLNSLTVGSINRYDNKRSAFSRIGKGPQNINKPDLVYYGGDVYVSDKELLTQEDFKLEGLKSLAVNGGLRQACGSSFACPVVAKVAAEVWALYPDFSKEEIKAYLIHNSYAKNHSHDLGFNKIAPSQKIFDSIKRVYKTKLELEENESYHLKLNKNHKYQITCISENQMNINDPFDYIKSYLEIKNSDNSKSNHKSDQIQNTEFLEIVCKGGKTNAILLVEQI